MTLAERLWGHVEKTDGCWNWTAAINDSGYGVITDRARKCHHRAHRLSWELAHGPIPADQLVLHKCDNRRCVRPDHLFLGDHAENARDKVAKGRQRMGDGHQSSKLKTADVIAIRTAPHDTKTRRELAKRFQVQQATICGIQAGRSWRHVQVEAAS